MKAPGSSAVGQTVLLCIDLTSVGKWGQEVPEHNTGGSREMLNN